MVGIDRQRLSSRPAVAVMRSGRESARTLTWQLLVHRKMMNLKGCHRSCAVEISPMVRFWSTDTQVALLRVLQEREFERVGGRFPSRCLRYGNGARTLPSCWITSSVATRGRHGRSSDASANAHSIACGPIRGPGNVRCATRDPAFDARIEDLRVRNQQESLSRARAEAFLTSRCREFHHWRHLARLASINARNFRRCGWNGSCVPHDCGVAEDSAYDGPDRPVHGQRPPRRRERRRAVPAD